LFEMSTRSRKRVLQKVENQLGETVRGFLLSVPQGCSPERAQTEYNRYQQQWKDYCRRMNNRHRWLKADATAFENRVTLLNRSAERKLQPVRYYAKRVLPFVALAVLIWVVTDVVLPYFAITQYMLFQ
jgi:hypothetical protein